MKLFEWFDPGKEEDAANLLTEQEWVDSKISQISQISHGRAFPKPAHGSPKRDIYINKIDNFLEASTRPQERERESASLANLANLANPARIPPSPLPWSGRMAELAAWFTQHGEELPQEPFQL